MASGAAVSTASAIRSGGILEGEFYAPGVMDLEGIQHFPGITEVRITPYESGTIRVPEEYEERISLWDVPYTDQDAPGWDTPKEIRIQSECAYGLDVRSYSISKLDLKGFSGLEGLQFVPDSQKKYRPNLKTLDVSHNQGLEHMAWPRGNLSKLILGENENMYTLDVSYNRLKKIDVSGLSSLRRVSVAGNRLTELDLYRNTDLMAANAAGNQIKKLILGMQALYPGGWFYSDEGFDYSQFPQEAFYGISGNRLHKSCSMPPYYADNPLKTVDITDMDWLTQYSDRRKFNRALIKRFVTGEYNIPEFYDYPSGTRKKVRIARKYCNVRKTVKKILIGKKMKEKDKKWLLKLCRKHHVKVVQKAGRRKA